MLSKKQLRIIYLGCLVTPMLAVAGEWRVTSSAGADLEYSDNVGLTETNTRDNLKLSFTPSIAISGEGRRLQGQFAYSPRIQVNTDSQEGNGIDHFLNANGTAELFDNRYFLDVRATAGINNILRNAPGGNAQTGNSTNTTQTYTYEIRPYFTQRLGTYASITGEVSHEQVINTDSTDSHSNAGSLTIASDRRLLKTNLALDLNHRRLYREEFPTSKFSNATMTVFHALNRKYTLRGSLGYENNEFATDDTGSPEGVIWNVGFEWNPNPRLSSTLTVGQRFFGHDINGSIEYQRKRSRLRGSISSGLSTSSAILFEESIFNVVDANGEVITDPVSGQPLEVVQNVPTLSDEIFVNHSIALQYFATGKRYNFNTRVFFTQRDYTATDRDEDDYGLSASYNYSLSNNQRLGFTTTWDRLREKSISRDFDRFDISLSYTQELGTHTSLRSALTRREGQYSNDTAESYVEHLATIGLIRRF